MSQLNICHVVQQQIDINKAFLDIFDNQTINDQKYTDLEEKCIHLEVKYEELEEKYDELKVKNFDLEQIISKNNKDIDDIFKVITNIIKTQSRLDDDITKQIEKENKNKKEIKNIYGLIKLNKDSKKESCKETVKESGIEEISPCSSFNSSGSLESSRSLGLLNNPTSISASVKRKHEDEADGEADGDDHDKKKANTKLIDPRVRIITHILQDNKPVLQAPLPSYSPILSPSPVLILHQPPLPALPTSEVVVETTVNKLPCASGPSFNPYRVKICRYTRNCNSLYCRNAHYIDEINICNIYNCDKNCGALLHSTKELTRLENLVKYNKKFFEICKHYRANEICDYPNCKFIHYKRYSKNPFSILNTDL